MKAEITKLPNISNNGLLYTTGGDGTLVASPLGNEGDLWQADALGAPVARSVELAIAKGYYKLKSALNPVFVMQNGTILTGNGGTTAFVEPISSLSYLKLSDIVADTVNTTSPMYINVVGLIGTGSAINKGIILGIDDLNYIELIWNRVNVCILRVIELGVVVSTTSTNIGNAIRGSTYQLEIIFGGEATRTGIGYYIKSARPNAVLLQYENTINSFRQNVTFIALANILNSPFDVQHNIGICGTKFS